MNNADRNSDRNFWRLQIKELFCHLFFPKKNWQQNHWRISIAIFFNDSCQNTNKLEKSSCKVVRKKINSCEMVTHYTGLCFCAHWILIRLDCNNNSSSNQLNKPLIWPLLALWQIALDNCFPTRGWKTGGPPTMKFPSCNSPKQSRLLKITSIGFCIYDFVQKYVGVQSWKAMHLPTLDIRVKQMGNYFWG